MASQKTPQIYIVREKGNSMYFVGVTDALAERVKQLEHILHKKLKVVFQYSCFERGNQLETCKAAVNDIQDYLWKTFGCPDKDNYFNVRDAKFNDTMITIFNICDKYNVNDEDTIADKNNVIEELNIIIEEQKIIIEERENKIRELEGIIEQMK